MTDVEILEKYKDTIAQDINKYFEEYNITDSFEKEKFAEKYRTNFVKGVKQGEREVQVEVSKKMLNDNFKVDTISEITGLTREEIEALKQ